MNLAELQRYFARAATSGRGPLPELDRVFLGNERLSAEDRLAIYNRGYFYRLLEALASVFSQTKRVLGESDFERLGLAYVAQHPSEHPAVERVGRSFSAYLRRVAAPPLVVDLARLEWARLCALVAPNPASVATASGIDAERFPRARLRFVPSLQWLELDPRTLPVFAGDISAPGAADISAPGALAAGGAPVAVWRREHVVHQLCLDEAEWKALLRAASDATLSGVCAVFDRGSQTEDERHAFQVLSSWFGRQWVAAVAYDARQPNSR